MAVATSTMLGRPVWYELMTSDMTAAEAFYRTVVGWKTSPFEGAAQPYTMFNRSADVPVAGVMTKPDEVKAPARRTRTARPAPKKVAAKRAAPAKRATASTKKAAPKKAVAKKATATRKSTSAGKKAATKKATATKSAARKTAGRSTR